MAHRFAVCHILAYASGLLPSGGLSFSLVLFFFSLAETPTRCARSSRRNVYFAQLPEADFTRARVASPATDRLCMLMMNNDLHRSSSLTRKLLRVNLVPAIVYYRSVYATCGNSFFNTTRHLSHKLRSFHCELSRATRIRVYVIFVLKRDASYVAKIRPGHTRDCAAHRLTPPPSPKSQFADQLPNKRGKPSERVSRKQPRDGRS